MGAMSLIGRTVTFERSIRTHHLKYGGSHKKGRDFGGEAIFPNTSKD